MPAALLLAGIAAVLAGCAQPGGASAVREAPADPRQAIVRGTTEGITLIPARGAPTSGASTGASAPAADGAASSPATGRGLAGLLKGLPPPTGVPLTEQKKLNDPDQGIPLPTAGSRGGAAR